MAQSAYIKKYGLKASPVQRHVTSRVSEISIVLSTRLSSTCFVKSYKMVTFSERSKVALSQTCKIHTDRTLRVFVQNWLWILGQQKQAIEIHK